MRKIFADSSIIIAGAASRTGASRAVLTMAEICLFKLVIQTSADFVRELREIVERGLGQ